MAVDLIHKLLLMTMICQMIWFTMNLLLVCIMIWFTTAVNSAESQWKWFDLLSAECDKWFDSLRICFQPMMIWFTTAVNSAESQWQMIWFTVSWMWQMIWFSTNLLLIYVQVGVMIWFSFELILFRSVLWFDLLLKLWTQLNVTNDLIHD